MNTTRTIRNTDTRLEGRDIVVIGLQPWYYEIGSNCKSMALQFAKSNRVLYVNAPINRKTVWAKEKTAGIRQHCEVIRSGRDTIRPVGANIWEFYPTSVVESINWLPSTAAFRAVNYLNNKRFAADLKAAIRALDFNDIILFNDNDIFNGYYLKELLQPSAYVYYSRDFLQGYAYWRKHCTVLEPELIRKADVAVANSTFLADYCARFNPRSAYIGQGCNLALFDHRKEHPEPPELADIPSPRIGYVGAIIADRLDIRILETIARARPDWSLVLVGPEDETFRQSGLHAMPNVHFIGRRPLEELPAFVQAFDVCINPQLVNNITIGNYPLKIDEYLALGKPVVATRTETMRLFEAHTYLAATPEEYPALIARALAEDDAQKQADRIAFAGGHTWEACMETLYGAIHQFEKQKAGRGVLAAAG